jgi:hypothetical protein
VPSLSLVVITTILDLHVHINRPYIHPLWIVGHYALKHRATTFRLIVLILQGAKLGYDVDVFGLRKSLQRPLEDSLGRRELISIHAGPHLE